MAAKTTKTLEENVFEANQQKRRDKKMAQNAAARRNAAANKANGVTSRTGSPDANRLKDALHKEHEERRARQSAVVEAWKRDHGIQAIRDQIAALEGTEPSNRSTREHRARRLTEMNAQLNELCGLLAKYGEKSGNLHGRDGRVKAIKAIKASNGYLGRIVRDALFGAHRRLMPTIVREGDAA